MSARVTLTNNTSKTMTHEGVLISTDGSIVEYEFADTLLPHETRYHLIGTEYLEKIPPNLPLPASAIKTLNRPIFTLAQHLGKVRTCWARIVQYSDGSYWEVSPL